MTSLLWYLLIAAIVVTIAALSAGQRQASEPRYVTPTRGEVWHRTCVTVGAEETCTRWKE